LVDTRTRQRHETEEIWLQDSISSMMKSKGKGDKPTLVDKDDPVSSSS